MALIKLKRPSDGYTITVDENSPIRTAYLQQGWVIDSGQQAAPAPVQAAQPTNTGWVDPATGQSTPVGVGEPKSEYDKRQQATTIPNEDKSWVNQLYQRYFDRDATSAELANWVKETPQALDQFLAKEQYDYGYTSKEMGETNKRRYDDAIAIINASDLPEDIKAIWRLTVGRYPNATDFETSEIINTFNKIKAETIDPYFKELADIAVKDIQTSLGEMKSSRDLELEAEQAAAKKAITDTQAGLEQSGMTFSGKGVKALGTDSAYAGTPTATTPVATPFAGITPELMKGTVGQANRLLSTSSSARYASQQQELGRRAEDYLGTSAVNNLGINYQPAGVNLTGQLANQAETQKASTLQSIINQWREKQNLATNQ